MEATQDPVNNAERVYLCRKCSGIHFEKDAFEEHKNTCTGVNTSSDCKYFVFQKPDNQQSSKDGSSKQEATKSAEISFLKDERKVHILITQDPLLKPASSSFEALEPPMKRSRNDNNGTKSEVESKYHPAELSSKHDDDQSEDSLDMVPSKKKSSIVATNRPGSDIQSKNTMIEEDVILAVKKEHDEKNNSISENRKDLHFGNAERKIRLIKVEIEDHKQDSKTVDGTCQESTKSVSSDCAANNADLTEREANTEFVCKSDQTIEASNVMKDSSESLPEKTSGPETQTDFDQSAELMRKRASEENNLLAVKYKQFKSKEKIRKNGKIRHWTVYKCQECVFVTPQARLFDVHITVKHAADVQKRLSRDMRYKINRPEEKSEDQESEVFDLEPASRRQFYRERNAKLEVRYAEFKQPTGYKCPVCAWATERGVGMLHRHMSSIHAWTDNQSPSVWKCERCNFETDVRRKFLEHQRKHDRPFVCTVCERGFINKRNLSDHMLLHTGEQPLKCDFPGCEYSAIQKRCMDDHKRKHTGERLKCPYCTFTTVYTTALSTHINMKHREKSRFPCLKEGCSYITNDKASFQRHCKVHANEKDFKCCHCDYRSVSKHQVVMHLQRVHNQEKQFACNRCPFTTGYAMSLRYHLMSHMGVKPYQCSACIYTSVQKVKIQNHISSKHANDKHAHVIDHGIRFDLDMDEYRIKPSAASSHLYYTVSQGTMVEFEGTPDNMAELAAASSSDIYTIPVPGQAEDMDLSKIADNEIPIRETISFGSLEIAAPSLLTSESGKNSENDKVEQFNETNQASSSICDNTADINNAPTSLNNSTDVKYVVNNDVIDVVQQQEALENAVYACAECDFTTQDYEGMASHMALHRGLRLFQCPHCGFSSLQLNAVETHVATEHSSQTETQINEISMCLENDISQTEAVATKS